MQACVDRVASSGKRQHCKGASALNSLDNERVENGKEKPTKHMITTHVLCFFSLTLRLAPFALDSTSTASRATNAHDSH